MLSVYRTLGNSIKGSRQLYFSVTHQRSGQLCISMLVVTDVGIAHINNFWLPPSKILKRDQRAYFGLLTGAEAAHCQSVCLSRGHGNWWE